MLTVFVHEFEEKFGSFRCDVHFRGFHKSADLLAVEAPSAVGVKCRKNFSKPFNLLLGEKRLLLGEKEAFL